MATQLPAANAGGALAAPKLLNTDQAAEALGLSRRTIQDLMARRELASVKIGRSVRFHPSDIADFVERNTNRPRGWKGATK